MKRYIYAKLLEWKASRNRKPLMLYGARQVGKTYILKEFGRKEFANLVYVNCYKNEAVRNIFSQDADIKRIVRDLSALTGETIRPEATLLFFDEVQEIPDIVASLKYFCEDAPDICVVAAGSLLGVMNMEDISFPTGKVNILHMFPMTFYEFMEAMGEEGKLSLLKDREARTSVNSMDNLYIDLLRQYYYVGGMPEAVKEYVATKDTEHVRQIQLDILSAYEADIAKHAGQDALKARMVLQTIPSQLSRENKRFVYGAVRKGARASQFENAIQWLVDAALVYKVCRASKPAMPLKFYIDNNVFKLYLLDIGLLGAMAGVAASTVMVGNNIFSEYKGAFTEDYVLTQLVTLPDSYIAYYTKENSTVEIDFILQHGDRIIPIEVKAEENVKSKSLRQFVTIDHLDKGLKGIRFSMKGFQDQDWMDNIPLFAVPEVLFF